MALIATNLDTWWMRFTIDVLALNESGVVVDRVTGLKPWRIRLPRRGTAGVLELPEGCIAATGTELGHRIQLTTGTSRPVSAGGVR